MNPTAGMVLEAWKDLDRATGGLSQEDASRRSGKSSSIAWYVAHSTHMVDRWLNQLFQKLDPHPLIDQDEFRIGATGDAGNWREILAAVAQVRDAARPFMANLTESDLDVRYPYHGSLEALRASGITPRYALIRIAAHTYLHLGEIVALRSALGYDSGEYPGTLEACI